MSCCCCFRRRKSGHSSRAVAGSVTAVNDQYMEWHSHERINDFLRDHRQRSDEGSASDDNLYIDPDEVPQHLRQGQGSNQHLPPPPPPPTVPRLQPPPPPPPKSLPAAAATDGDLVYAELETGALNVPAAAAAELSRPTVPPPPPPPAPTTPLLASSQQLPPATPAGARDSELDADGNAIIYSDIVGVLRPDEA